MQANKKRVGILRGGTEENYMSSIEEGANLITHILENLSDKYKIVDVLVDRNGVWYINGIQSKPSELMHRVDVVWNTAHSNLSPILSQFSIPTVGIVSSSNVLLSNRSFLEQHIKDLNIRMPRHIVLPVYQKDFDGMYGSPENYANRKAQEVFQKFAGPWIVRSFTPDISMGVHVAKSLPELERAILDALEHKTSILVEELIEGQIVPVHSLRGFRGEDVYTFPFGNFLATEKEKINNIAKTLHRHLGEHTYLKSNFLLTPKGNLYLTGVLFSPNLKNDSHFSKSVESIGAKMHQIVEHILERVS